MNCQGIGRILGHKYEARYDRKPPQVNSPAGSLVYASEMVRLIEAGTQRIYRGDVCTRCGHIVNSPKEQA